MIKALSFAIAITALSSASAMASDIPKFSKTCVGDFGLSSSICLSSNGTSISSSYIFRKKYRTTGSHKGCSLKGSTIKCTGGTYRTSEGSGKMNSVTVKLSNGKPTSLRWN